MCKRYHEMTPDEILAATELTVRRHTAGAAESVQRIQAFNAGEHGGFEAAQELALDLARRLPRYLGQTVSVVAHGPAVNGGSYTQGIELFVQGPSVYGMRPYLLGGPLRATDPETVCFTCGKGLRAGDYRCVYYVDPGHYPFHAVGYQLPDFCSAACLQREYGLAPA